MALYRPDVMGYLRELCSKGGINTVDDVLYDQEIEHRVNGNRTFLMQDPEVFKRIVRAFLENLNCNIQEDENE